MRQPVLPAHIESALADRLRAARDMLFPTPTQSLVSAVLIVLAAAVTYAFLDWAIFKAVFRGDDGSACRVPGAGACWPFISHKLALFLYGRYPDAELWRVHLTYALALAGVVPLLWPGAPRKRELLVYLLLVLPVLAFVLLGGGVLGLPLVTTDMWGGLLLTLVIASFGIAASFPLGVLLALARRSELPLARWTAIGYIELVRGVPLVTVLFMASVMLPLFLPPDVTIDKLVRALV
ncbi:MAG: ABC transporter permease subunit, partial [Hyphomicrobium sp.]